jgi:hypothetical protein
MGDAETLAAIFVPLCSCAVLLFFGAMVFPSMRQALAARLRGKRGSDPDDAAAVSEQLMALRNEVYALRCEVAAVAQALPARDQVAGRIGQG